MRPDHPILAAAVFLAAGLPVVLCHVSSGSGLNAAFIVSNFSFDPNVAKSSAALGQVISIVLGGLFLICIIFFLLWLTGTVFDSLAEHWRRTAGQGETREKISSH